MGPHDTPATSPTLLGELWDLKNERAWGRFLAQYKPLIDAWCARWGLQPADTEEVSAKVLYDLARAMPTFRYDPALRFRAWLRVVVDNAVRTYWRDLGRRPGARGSGDPEVYKNLAETADPGEVEGLVLELEETIGRDLTQAQEVLAQVRARVKDHTWQAYWLTAIEGQPAKEVAAHLGLTTAAVYVAKKRVGDMLRAAGAELRRQDADVK